MTGDKLPFGESAYLAVLELTRRNLRHLISTDPRDLTSPQLKMIVALTHLHEAVREQSELKRSRV